MRYFLFSRIKFAHIFFGTFFIISSIMQDAGSETVQDKYEKMSAGSLFENRDYLSFQKKGQIIGVDNNGLTIVVYPDWGLLETVKMVNGKRDGESIVQDPVGGLWIKRNYVRGKKTGKCITYGWKGYRYKLIETEFKNGVKHGIEKIYNVRGELNVINYYKHGVHQRSDLKAKIDKRLKEDRKSYYPGRKLSPEYFKEKKSYYHQSNKIVQESFIDKGTGQYVRREYYYTGNISVEEVYSAKGDCIYRKLFSEDGSWHRKYVPDKEVQHHRARISRNKKNFNKEETSIPIDEDEYEVISSIVLDYVGSIYEEKKDLQTVLIADRSIKTYAYSGDRVYDLPVYELTGDRKTLADFIKKNLKYYDFENKFKGAKTFNIVADNNLEKYGKKYFDFLFSRVGFNSFHTEAVVYMEQWGSGHLVLLMKNDQKWQLVKMLEIWIV